MSRRRVRAALLAALAATALGATGCGGHSSLSNPTLRADAGRVCSVTRARTGRLKVPTAPSQGEAFLRRGLAALGPELSELRTLSPSTKLSSDYGAAVDDLAAEVAAIRSTVAALRTGADPLDRFPELQRALAPLEARANAAWQGLGIDACVER
jgi:ABC-type phosphate/phosphonate transport system substrate-binding protein